MIGPKHFISRRGDITYNIQYHGNLIMSGSLYTLPVMNKFRTIVKRNSIGSMMCSGDEII